MMELEQTVTMIANLKIEKVSFFLNFLYHPNRKKPFSYI